MNKNGEKWADVSAGEAQKRESPTHLEAQENVRVAGERTHVA